MPDEPGRAMLCSTLLESEQSRRKSSTSNTALSRTRLQGDTPTLSRLPLWRDFPYEYERGKLAIDVINGGRLLREWVDDGSATPETLDAWRCRTSRGGCASARRI